MKNQIQIFGVVILAMLFVPGAQAVVNCTNIITADVVVLDNPTVFNRLGAQNPNWITYALKRDVVDIATQKPCTIASCTAGNVELRPDKRPRPLVVRSIAESCLRVNFTNLLDPIANPNDPIQDLLDNNDQVADRCASFHAQGVELVNDMDDDGSFVGKNNPGLDPFAVCGAGAQKAGLVGPNGTITYDLYTPKEGTFTVNSYGATIGSEQSSGNLGIGMFAQLNVEPKGARIYRSQMTEEEMRLATTGTVLSDCAAAGFDQIIGTVDDIAPPPGETVGVTCNPGGQPIIDYEAVYPTVEPWISEGKAGLPIVNMLDGNVLVHSDINAIIAGPDADGSWNSVCDVNDPNGTADCPYPLESVGKNNPQLPNRLEPFREFSSIYHDEQTNSQVFPRWYTNPVLQYTLAGVKDQFMINYGSGGIGSEIISNRLHTGPMHDCTDCAYEEFFLASQTVGDPGLLVNYPANTNIEQCLPTNIAAGPDDPNPCWRLPNLANGPVQLPNPLCVNPDPTIPPDPFVCLNAGGNPIAAFVLADNFALFQEDPSNVHHSYTGDFVKIRNIHAGAFEQHIFHLHNNQWLFNPNDDNSNYLDAQEIMPGSGHTYELANGGAGNRNRSAGDAIFHCHFYPHFAQGMWYHLRIQDTFEKGTVLAVSGAADPHDPPLFDGTGANFHANAFDLRSGKPMAGARALPDGELAVGASIPAILPLPGQAMPQMPAKVSVAAIDRGGHSLLGGRTPPDGIPDSGQAFVDMASVRGPDDTLGTADDVNPGFPFWLAGNTCGVDGAIGDETNPTVCPQGIVGQRMPTPPLDMLTVAGANDIAAGDPSKANWPALAGGWDGGLPRHALLGYVSGGLSADTNNRLDFRKIIELAQPVYFPEVGTELEQVAMGYHAVRERPSAANNLNGTGTTAADFITNGADPVPGGAYMDPCSDDAGISLGEEGSGSWFDGNGGLSTLGTSPFDASNPRTYRVANVQIDAVFNKVGYHYPQERIIALWGDVEPTILKQRPPEPLVMRFNTFDCGKILHTNLVPAEFEVDDFQVRTPTDIIGQHIHLPKWDLTTGDGAANGWNYEDGALSPGMVHERTLAITEFNHLAGSIVGEGCDPLGINGDPVPCPLPGQLAPIDLTDLAQVPTIPNPCNDDVTAADCGVMGGLTELAEVDHPFFGAGVAGQNHKGARTVIQRILVDPIVNVAGVDRGLGLTFSHDHYGPSTFQQIGLYSTILAEPAGSTWAHNESGDTLGGRMITLTDGETSVPDGGPTSWQAIIDPPDTSPVPDHREFYFELSDFQHAYEQGVFIGANGSGIPVETVINQPNVFDVTNATVAAGEPLADSWQQTINPPLKLKSVPFPDVVTANAGCPGPLGNNDPNIPRPCAEAINISHSSMFVVNYRNEPVGLRVFDPNAIGPDGQNGSQAAGLAGDLAFALQTRTDRAIPQLNTRFGDMPPGYTVPAGHCQGNSGDGINCDRRAGDPITPIMRAYEGDDVKIKIQVGATEEQHQTSIHGIKWLSNGSGFGSSPNSGWRNFQSHGISEQFSLQVPINADPNQTGNRIDYLYAQDATRDGFWTGSWGLLRAYGNNQQDLERLPSNPRGNRRLVNQTDFNGVCPKVANVVAYDVTAVLANDVLPNALGVTIPQLGDVDPSMGNTFGEQTVGGPLTGTGTLLFNRRQTNVPTITVAEPGLPAEVFRGGDGPLNDPTAMMYVMTSDLVVTNPADPGCALVNPDGTPVLDPATGLPATDPVVIATCPVTLADTAPVEPIVLRANAGACIETILRNRLPAVAPDLAGWQDMMWVVTRNIQVGPTGLPEMHFFNNNLIRPSSHVGLHAQLVDYDASRDDGVLVGTNSPDQQIVAPGGARTYRWYAGDLSSTQEPGRGNNIDVTIVATPVEFGGSNLLSADRVKQPQKALFGSLVIEPADAVVTEGTLVADSQANELATPEATRLTRAQVDVSSSAGTAGSGGDYRENLLIGHKISNLRWADGTAIANIHQGELGREGAEDSGHAGFNYGMEPSWFRFKLPPDVPFGAAPAAGAPAGAVDTFGELTNAHAMYSNNLVVDELNAVPTIAGVSVAGDPATPVFRAPVDAAGANPVTDTRMFVLNGASADRDGTYMLHGHVWQRDPHVCTGLALAVTGPDAGVAQDPEDASVPLVGRCDPTANVPSTALGLNAQAKYMGGQEGMGHAYGHWPILFDAGGTGRVTGDYLVRDYSPSGNRNGQFGILRVEDPPAP